MDFRESCPSKIVQVKSFMMEIPIIKKSVH